MDAKHSINTVMPVLGRQRQRDWKVFSRTANRGPSVGYTRLCHNFKDKKASEEENVTNWREIKTGWY